MSIEEELAKASPGADTLLSIGVFDGVHLGHQHLLKHLRREARERGYLSGVVTFPRHPRLVLHPETSLNYIASLPERIRLIKALGIEVVAPVNFTLEVAQLSTRQFVSLLKKHLRMRGLLVGDNFALGKGRRGTPSVLESLGKELGFTVEVVAPKLLNGQMVSSTAVREALSAGDMTTVIQLLGRPFSITGTVVHGVARGRTLGFPTANLAVDAELALPPDGVYAARVCLDGKGYEAVTNIGRRPTFDNGERSVEVFLLDFHQDLYGSEVRLEFIDRLRSERRFDNAEQLKAQISRDVELAKFALKNNPPENLGNDDK